MGLCKCNYIGYVHTQIYVNEAILCGPSVASQTLCSLPKIPEEEEEEEEEERGYFSAGYVRLPLRSVYSKTVLYSAVRSLLSPVFCVFSNFAPIPMYRENETPCAIPT